MKKPKLDDYELFYMEIPQADYLNDFEINVDEEHELPAINKTPTMSDEQVSALAQDQLAGINQAKISAKVQNADTLFSSTIE